MKTLHPTQEHILNKLENGGEMSLHEIFADLPDIKDGTRDYHIKQLIERGDIERIKNGVFRKSETVPEIRFKEKRKQMSKQLRTAEDNEETISKLLNLYDDILDFYIAWIALNLSSDTDFEKQLLFIENFKWLTMIADKLMKRWALVHVGYDTNSRQAQEDAKAKTEAKQKEALKDAPVEDQVTVLGSFDLETKQLIDNFPTLEDISEEEGKELTV